MALQKPKESLQVIPKLKELSCNQVMLLAFVSDLTHPRKTISPSLLQKYVFLAQEKKSRHRPCFSYDFMASHFGPFSKDIVDDLKILQKKRFLKIEKGKIRQMIRPTCLRVIATDEIETAFRVAKELKGQYPDDSSVVISTYASAKVQDRVFGEPIK